MKKDLPWTIIFFALAKFLNSLIYIQHAIHDSFLKSAHDKARGFLGSLPAYLWQYAYMEYLEQIYEKMYVIIEILNVFYDEIKELNKQSKFSDFKSNFSWHLNL